MSLSLAHRVELVDEAVSPWQGDPWDQQPGESSLWFSRFQNYLRLGPRRTIDGAARTEKGLAPDEPLTYHWRDEASRGKWVERAQAWDAHELAREQEEFEEYRKTARQARIAAIFQFQDLTARRLETLDPAELEWKDVRENLKVAHADMRAEFDEEPRQRTELTGRDGGPMEHLLMTPQQWKELASKRLAAAEETLAESEE